MEGLGALAADLPEQVGLRVDVGVERALLQAERLGQVADGGAVIAFCAKSLAAARVSSARLADT